MAGNRINKYSFAILAGLVLVAVNYLLAAAVPQNSTLEPNPGKAWIFTSEFGVESLSFRATGYSQFVSTEREISFLLAGFRGADAKNHNLGGAALSTMKFTQENEGTRVAVSLYGSAGGVSINAAPASRAFPDSPTVVLALTGITPRRSSASSAGADDEYPSLGSAKKNEGDYELPPFERRYKYSDTLVSLHVKGASISGVLEFLSLVGNVSIVLDPYWNQQPTGGGRPPIESGGSAGGGGAGGIGTGGGGAGFGGFGQGLISVDIDDVPFDFALDLIITSAGLKYVEIR